MAFHLLQTNKPDSVIHALQPVFWMDARQAPAGVVTTMLNRGSAGGSFTAPVTGPTKGTNTRGAPALEFSTAAHRLAFPAYTYGRGMTLITVEEQPTAVGSMVSLWTGVAGNTDLHYIARSAAGGGGTRNFTIALQVNAVPGPAQVQYRYTTNNYAGVVCGLSWWDGTQAAASEQRLEVNGVTVATTVGSAAETSVGLGAATGLIGAYGQNTALSCYIGNISQALVFNRALSAAECLAAYKALRLICNIA